MSATLSDLASRREPGKCDGTDLANDPKTIRDGLYRALHAALDHFPGGVQQLAEELGAARSDTYLRVGRKEDSKGNLQRAFLDFLAPVLAKRAAALVWATEMNKLLDLEPPVARKRVTLDEIGRAWLKQLEALPPGEREGRRADMAAALGIPVEALR
jgi:hypothetical protein